MGSGSRIKSVFARQVFARQEFSGLGHPAIETMVTTEEGTSAVAMVTAGFSVGKHEAHFIFDRGERWGGYGVLKAVSNVINIIGPALKGIDATKQREVDEILIKLDGTPNMSELGANATASVSAATLKAGAVSLGVPLYQHIGGVSACTLPVPGVICIDGSDRYGAGKRAGNKPSYSFVCYGFKSFSQASYACWEVGVELRRVLSKKFGADFQIADQKVSRLAPGRVKNDEELWHAMTEAIENLEYKNRVGIQVDVAASAYYDNGKFVGLFSNKDRTREDLIELYKYMVKQYPFVIFEDPLDEDDYEGHAILTKEIGIQIVGDDLFATNSERLQRGISVGACSALLVKTPQIGTVSQALDVVQLAHGNGYGVVPCGSRGEGPDIADYAVGLNTGQIREGGLGPTANRLLQIENELGSNGKFLGKAAIKIG